jgi:hypothetical protein
MREGAQQADRVLDARPRHWFYIDNAVIDQHAAAIGAMGLAVYTALVRHANGSGKAYPSLRRLERLLGISRHTLIKYLDVLEKHQLIAKHYRKSADGDATSTLYRILPVGGAGDTPGGATSAPPGEGDAPQVVQPVHHGGARSAPEGLKSLKDLRDLKDLNPPHSPPLGGGLPVSGKTLATPRMKKKTGYPTDPDAQATLRALVFDAAFDTWVRDKGLTLDLGLEWERFGSKALAKGYQYVDWRHAFMCWLTSPYQPKAAAAVGNSKTMAPEAFMAEMDKWKGRI